MQAQSNSLTSVQIAHIAFCAERESSQSSIEFNRKCPLRYIEDHHEGINLCIEEPNKVTSLERRVTAYVSFTVTEAKMVIGNDIYESALPANYKHCSISEKSFARTIVAHEDWSFYIAPDGGKEKTL